MKKEKLASLEKYVAGLTDRLNSATPDKHKDHPETYKAFLKNEIRMTKLQLDAARLEAMGGSK